MDEPRPGDAGYEQLMRSVHLRPPAHRVDPKAKSLWITTAALLSVVPVVGLAVCTALLSTGRIWWALGLAVTVAIAVVYIGVMPWWRFRVHRWEVTEVSVYAQSGWITRHRIIIPVNRIQVVDTVAGPLEQLFGLSTLKVTTASLFGTVSIEGLNRDVARDLSNELARYAIEDDDDAT